MFYREESKKIFVVIRKFAKLIEKAGCDEAFLNITEEVNEEYQTNLDFDYNGNWEGAYFMPFGRNENGLA